MLEYIYIFIYIYLVIHLVVKKVLLENKYQERWNKVERCFLVTIWYNKKTLLGPPL